jgi:hypothetical protein
VVTDVNTSGIPVVAIDLRRAVSRLAGSDWAVD